MVETQDKTVTKAELDAAEASVLAADKLKDDQARSEAKKLVEDAVSRGKEEAMKEFEQKQVLKNLQDENKKMAELVKKLDEDKKRELQLIRDETMKKFQEIEGRSKAPSKNDSPFNGSDSTNETDAEKIDIDQINELSRKHMLGW